MSARQLNSIQWEVRSSVYIASEGPVSSGDMAVASQGARSTINMGVQSGSRFSDQTVDVKYRLDDN